uniref:Uncharacterized protein n=1 Tax=Anguilla anguilla TaxID=7936 RepID=A0A0E9VNC2_ANGAN
MKLANGLIKHRCIVSLCPFYLCHGASALWAQLVGFTQAEDWH